MRNLDADTSILRTMTDLVCSIHDTPSPLEKAKLEALQTILKRIHAYRDHGFEEPLLIPIASKKTDMVQKATTKAALREIVSPPAPHHDGKHWIASPYSVDEEELIAWSLASYQAPLNHLATERMMTLFHRIYGKTPEEVAQERARKWAASIDTH